MLQQQKYKKVYWENKKNKKTRKKKPESFHFDPVYLRKEHTDLRMCFMGMIMTKTRLKAAVALSLCVGRFCAKSINMESSPHSVHAPTLHSPIHRLFTAQIFIHLCSCTPHAHTLTHTHTHTHRQQHQKARWMWVASLSPLHCSLISPDWQKRNTDRNWPAWSIPLIV